MFRLIALGIFAISACAQTAMSPYDLARVIDSHNVDWASIWKKLGVAKPPEAPICDVSRRCSADVITVLKPSQAIVVVQARPENVYLRFLEDSSGWRFAGSHGSSARFQPARYVISRMGTENRLGFGVSREIHADATAGGGGTIDLDLEVRYTSAWGTDLGFAKYRGVYQRAANQRKFTLREVTPSISNKDFEALANIDGGDQFVPTNEQLLVYTLPRLKEIASGSDARDREWLASVLSFCKDTEKRTLQALLASKR